MRAPQVKAAFELALAVKQTVRQYDNYPLILKALAGFGEARATHGEILKVIRQGVPTYPSGNLTTARSYPSSAGRRSARARRR
ncbi:hypothetical protein DLJ96_01860 [Actinotalea fermentans ATCC 43279 = JCM 9966 = DSM 3133]|nr:hypothetical protein DLJ96_01860 [Actinotalea fermentans ATCC 43279 = JCM 9966 = DSM 3133]